MHRVRMFPRRPVRYSQVFRMQNTSVTGEGALLGRMEKQLFNGTISTGLLKSTARTERILENSIQMMEAKISRATRAEVLLAADYVDY